MSKVFIYGLVDPRTNEIRYIGKTINIAARLKGHVREIKDSRINTKKIMWLRELNEIGLHPLITVLEEVDESCWGEKEKEYIARFRKLSNLTNTLEGGEGPSFDTYRDEDYIKQQSENQKKVWQNPEYRKKALKTLEKISSNKEYHKKHSEYMKKRISEDEEFVKNLRKAASKASLERHEKNREEMRKDMPLEEIKKFIEQGKTYKEIGKYYGLSDRLLTTRLENLYNTNFTKLRDEHLRKIMSVDILLQMIKEGHTLYTMAKHFGYPKGTFNSMVQKLHNTTIGKLRKTLKNT